MSSQLLLIIFTTISLGIIFLAALIILGRLRTRGYLERALNMSLFSVVLPREFPSAQQGVAQKSEKELISVMEQLISSFSNIHSKGWNKFLYGEPYVAIEVAVHHVGKEIYFYISVPRKSEEIFEKQIHGFFPTAEIQKIKDYTIFNSEGVAIGGYLKIEGNPLLPFKTYQNLESDPLNGIITSLSKIQEEGEGAAIQILIRPSHRKDLKTLAQKVAREMQGGYDFKKALSRAKNPPKKNTGKDGQKPEDAPMPVTPFGQEIIKAIQNKASKQTFDTNIRVIVSAESKIRATQILEDISGSFVQYNAPDLNQIKLVKLTGGAARKLAFNFSFRIFDNKQVNQLSTEEIASFYHFPIVTTQAPSIKFLKSKQSEPPAELPREGLMIGKNIFRGHETAIKISDNDRRRHFYVIGQTGTGKTSLMKEMVRQDIENGKGICVIDPHGEFAEYALSVVPVDRAEDVIYFNPGDIEMPMGINMLEIDSTKPEQKSFVINELLTIIDRLYNLKETGGPMFEKYFKNSVLLLLDDYGHEVPTLADISRVLVNDEFRADKLSREGNPLVKEFWKLEAEKAGGEASLTNMAPYISSKVDTFISNEYLRPIITQQKSSFNFREVMDSQKILIVNLSKGKIGDINANLLGMIIVGKLLMAALSRVDITDESQRKDFYLYMDEFQNFTTDSIATILSEARKYRLNLIIAHQFIKQLREDIRNAVFGNVGSMAVFRVGAEDSEFLKNQFEPIFNVQDIMNIDNFNAYVKLLINNQTARPFNIQTIKEKSGSREITEAIKELSRRKYGRPRDEVEKELISRYQR